MDVFTSDLTTLFLSSLRLIANGGRGSIITASRSSCRNMKIAEGQQLSVQRIIWRKLLTGHYSVLVKEALIPRTQDIRERTNQRIFLDVEMIWLLGTEGQELMAPEVSQPPLWFFQGHITRIIFHVEETVRLHVGTRVTSQGCGGSSATIAFQSSGPVLIWLLRGPSFQGKYTVLRMELMALNYNL